MLAVRYHTNKTENKYAKVTLLSAVTFYHFLEGNNPMKVPTKKLVLVIGLLVPKAKP